MLPGVLVGHDTDSRSPTGVTVLLLPDDTTVGVDVRGAAPGTRETDLLDPVNTIDVAHAIVLSGGSAYGLDAAGGVMAWLEDHGRGIVVGPARVPIVPAAVIFDLGVGDPRVRPDAAAGWRACDAGQPIGSAPQGNVGAGAGASLGKLGGPHLAMRGGLGIATMRAGGLAMAAVVVVNAVGDVVDPDSGALLAGRRRSSESLELIGSVAWQLGAGEADPAQAGVKQVPASAAADGDGGESAANTELIPRDPGGGASLPTNLDAAGASTTIGVVVTDARLTKAQATRLAQVAHDGLARTIRPVHTPMDGDTMFAAATGTVVGSGDPGPGHADDARGHAPDMLLLSTMASEVTASAVLSAVRSARGLRLPGLWLPAWADRL